VGRVKYIDLQGLTEFGQASISLSIRVTSPDRVSFAIIAEACDSPQFSVPLFPMLDNHNDFRYFAPSP
jgi:hypothetical protein